MGYKYFDEGLNGETGKRVDRLCDEKLDDNLAGVFRYPLRIDYSSEEEDVDIPAIAFHVVRVGMSEIFGDTAVTQFQKLLVEVPHNIHLILDLGGVSRVDESGIASLITFQKFMMQHHTHFFLANLEVGVKNKVQTMRLDRVFRICDTTQEAYEQIQAIAA